MKQKNLETLYLPKSPRFDSYEFIFKLSKTLNYKIVHFSDLNQTVSEAQDENKEAIICTDESESLAVDLVKTKRVQISSPQKLIASFEQMVCSILVYPQPKNSNLEHMLRNILSDISPKNSKPFFLYTPSDVSGYLSKLKPTMLFVGSLPSTSIENLPNIKLTFNQTQESVVFNWDQIRARDLSKSIPSKRISYGSFIGCDVRLYQASEKEKLINIEVMVGKQLYNLEFDRVKAKTSDVLACLAVFYSLFEDTKECLESTSKYLKSL